MRIPQTPERIKEAPAQALRVVFASVGQVLLMTERVRRRGTGHEHASPASTVGSRPASAPAASAPAASAPAASAPAPAHAAEARGPAQAAGPAASDLPVPSYSEASVASLRARLRGLDAGQVRTLLDYERSHEARPNVITMFERRITKLEGAEDAGHATD